MRDKYKDEIEEILRKAGEVAPSDSGKESERHPEDRPRETQTVRRAPVQSHQGGRRRWTITSGKLMLAGLVLFLIGLVIQPFIWIGLFVLVGAYLIYFLKPRTINTEKRWRGRSVEETPPSSWDWLKRRFKG
jgi:hypothetical protein